MTAALDAPILSLQGISKSFPGVRALSDVSMDLYAGQVTALIGENGAGKSTVVKTLTGIYQPDAGKIVIDGQPVILSTPHSASHAGITAIHQETVLFDDLSVAENIYLGHAPKTKYGLIDWPKLNKKASDLLTSIGSDINPKTTLRDMGIANKHLVAIARALSIDARVVIMDEPTAALSHKEITDLYSLVDMLKSQGKAILFISHKFDEVFKIADRYTVFRDGALVGHGMMADVTEPELVKMMVGRELNQVFPKRTPNITDTILQVDDLSHPTEFADISFSLKRGEILGFYGLVGAGRSEVMQAIFGITKPSRGTLKLNGLPLTITATADATAHGIVYVPEDRAKQGAITGLPIFQNVTLPSLSRLSRNGFLQMAREFELAREYTARLDLRAASLDTATGDLSGGNQQKVVIAKWLATNPSIIILDEPTKGIDIGSKAAVHQFMAELAAAGLAVIMVSSEIPEILGMSDRVIIMRDGRIAAHVTGDDLNPETLVRFAAGISA